MSHSTLRLLKFANRQRHPLLKVFLHAHAAPLKQILDLLDFAFHVFQFVVIVLVLLFHGVDLFLELILLGRPNNLAVVINHAAHSVLLPNLLNATRAFFDLVAGLVYTCTELFAARVFIF